MGVPDVDDFNLEGLLFIRVRRIGDLWIRGRIQNTAFPSTPFFLMEPYWAQKGRSLRL